MIIYFLTFFVSIFFGYYAQKLRQYKRNTVFKQNIINMNFSLKEFLYIICCIIAALPLILIASIRYNVGTDYAVYLPRFELALNYTIGNYKETNFDLGYFLLAKFIMNICNNTQVVFAITAIIFTFFIWKYIFKFSINVPLSIYLLLVSGIFSYSLNIMRQMICIAVFFYALKYIKNRELTKYVLVILCCCFIHISAFIYLPLYFILNKKFSKKLLLLVPVVILFADKIKLLMMTLVSNISFLSNYSSYFLSKYDMGNVQTVLVLLNLVIMICALLFDDFQHGFINKIEYNNCYMFFNLQIIAFIISLFGFIIPNADRIIYMFMPVQLIYIPLIIRKSGKYCNILKIIFIFLYTLFFIYYIGFKNYGETLPYITIFN